MCEACESNELSAESLAEVSGGLKGLPSDPWTSVCWFHAGSEAEFRSGAMRKKCNQYKCKALIVDDAQWHQCGCWGTDKCVGNWHYADGCPSSSAI